MYEEENWDDEIAGLPPKSMSQPPVARQEWRPSSSSFSREQKSNTVCTCNHQTILLTNKYLLQSVSLNNDTSPLFIALSRFAGILTY